jgi:hypothetical protein
VHQVDAFLVRQGAGSIYHAGEFHLSVAENFICLADIVATGRALVFGAGVDSGRAFRANGHRVIYSCFSAPGEDLLLSWLVVLAWVGNGSAGMGKEKARLQC